MNDLVLKLYVAIQSRLSSEEAQSTSEYALTVALVAFGAVAGESYIARSVNQTFTAITTVITTGISPQ